MTVDPDDIPQAASILARACMFCPAVRIDFMDDDGEVFATAVVPIVNVEPLIGQMRRRGRACDPAVGTGEAAMRILHVDEAIPGVDEVCAVCAHCLRPGMFLVCGNRESEFYGGPIVGDGYCPEFKLVAAE